jgi:putative chitinase
MGGIVYIAPLTKVCIEKQINTPERLAAFLATISYETGGFQHFEENLHYSTPERLLAVFPSHFKDLEDAKEYVNNPEKTGNRVYANRMGNSDEASGDGWKYRGRGLPQLTGKNNYEAFYAYAKARGVDLLDNPDMLLQPNTSCEAAGWFWETNNLNIWADKDFKTVCQKVNGGLNGYDQRVVVYNHFKALLPPEIPKYQKKTDIPMTQPSSGTSVAASGGVAAAAITVFTWFLNMAHVLVPAEVQAAGIVLLTWAAGVFLHRAIKETTNTTPEGK